MDYAFTRRNASTLNAHKYVHGATAFSSRPIMEDQDFLINCNTQVAPIRCPIDASNDTLASSIKQVTLTRSR